MALAYRTLRLCVIEKGDRRLWHADQFFPDPG
jgi:hypothetical protein